MALIIDVIILGIIFWYKNFDINRIVSEISSGKDHSRLLKDIIEVSISSLISSYIFYYDYIKCKLEKKKEPSIFLVIVLFLIVGLIVTLIIEGIWK